METKFEKFKEKFEPYIYENKPFYGLNNEYMMPELSSICPYDQSLSFRNRNNTHYLLIGESGTGKEFEAGNIAKRLFPDLPDPLPTKNRFNCACTTDKLVHSFLFGYAKDSHNMAHKETTTVFTTQRKKSDPRPVVFLDELHRLPLEGQAALLRAVEYNELHLFGDDKLVTYKDSEEPQECPIIIAAIQPKAINDGSLLPDLKNRFSKEIYLFSLCETVNRIPGLVALFILEFLCKNEIENSFQFFSIPEISMLFLASYDFPGNIRQLKNIVFNSCEQFLNDNIEIFKSGKLENFHHFRFWDDYLSNCDGQKTSYVLSHLFGLERKSIMSETEYVDSGLYSFSFATIEELKEAGLLKFSLPFDRKKYDLLDISNQFILIYDLIKYKYPIRYSQAELYSIKSNPKYYHLDPSDPLPSFLFRRFDELQESYKHRKEIMAKAWDEARIEVYKAAAKPVLQKQLGISPSENGGKVYFNKIRKNEDELIDNISSCIFKGINTKKKIAMHYGVSEGTITNALKPLTFKIIKARVSS